MTSPQRLKDRHHRWDIFLSHAGEDKTVARELVRQLRDRNFRVWIDENDLNIGDPFETEIKAALKQSRFCVVLLSQSYIIKEWPMKELRYVLEEVSGSLEEKGLLPVRIEITTAEMKAACPELGALHSLEVSQGVSHICDRIERKLAEQRSFSERVMTNIAALGRGITNGFRQAGSALKYRSGRWLEFLVPALASLLVGALFAWVACAVAEGKLPQSVTLSSTKAWANWLSPLLHVVCWLPVAAFLLSASISGMGDPEEFGQGCLGLIFYLGFCWFLSMIPAHLLGFAFNIVGFNPIWTHHQQLIVVGVLYGVVGVITARIWAWSWNW